MGVRSQLSNWFFQSAKFSHDLAPLLDPYLNQVLIASVDRCQLVVVGHGSPRVDVICIGNRSETVSTQILSISKSWEKLFYRILPGHFGSPFSTIAPPQCIGQASKSTCCARAHFQSAYEKMNIYRLRDLLPTSLGISISLVIGSERIAVIEA